MLRMPMVRIVFARVFLFVLLTSYKRSGTAPLSNPSQPSPRSARATEKIEACALITEEEVGAVQGTTISNTASSEGASGDYLMTQCYYASIGPNLSVSLAISQADPKNPSGVSATSAQIADELLSARFGRTDAWFRPTN